MNPDPTETTTAIPPDKGSSSSVKHEWQAIIQHRWRALAQEVLEPGPQRQLRLRDLAQELEFLAVVVAWFQHHGNVTHTATFLRSNRKSVRERIVRWRERYPRLVPPVAEPADPTVGKRSRGDEAVVGREVLATHVEGTP